MMTFHIIYTPGTVRHLYLFLLSILEHTTISLRLVSNACTPEEIDFLRKITATNERLELYIYPTDTVELHSTLLRHLQKRETSEYFCFMDSDIFVTADFIPYFQKQLEKYDAVFSCVPLWSTDNQLAADYPGAIGRFVETTNGICMGVSYFAIYKNEILKEFLDTENVDFSVVRWSDIPRKYQEILESLSLKKHLYDTAKLLNIILYSVGGKLHYADHSDLHHIGGLSWYCSKVINSFPFAKHSVANITHQDFQKAMPDLGVILKSREEMCEYFMAHLASLFTSEAQPPRHSFHNEKIDRHVEKVINNLDRLYEAHKGDLQGML